MECVIIVSMPSAFFCCFCCCCWLYISLLAWPCHITLLSFCLTVGRHTKSNANFLFLLHFELDICALTFDTVKEMMLVFWLKRHLSFPGTEYSHFWRKLFETKNRTNKWWNISKMEDDNLTTSNGIWKKKTAEREVSEQKWIIKWTNGGWKCKTCETKWTEFLDNISHFTIFTDFIFR